MEEFITFILDLIFHGLWGFFTEQGASSSATIDSSAIPTELPALPSPSEQLDAPSHSLFGVLALITSVAMAFLCGVVLYANFSDTLFAILFFGIPIGCLAAISLSMMALWDQNSNQKLPLIALIVSTFVFAGFALWHFMALGLAGAYYPCLVDLGAIVISVLLLAIFRRRTSNQT